METENYESYKENTTHGSPMLPFVTYGAAIPFLFRNYPIHWHDEMEIIYIHRGRGIISMNLSDHIVSEGDIVLITPGMLHSMAQYHQDSMVYNTILFHLNMLLPASADACTIEYFIPLLKNEIFLPMVIHPGDPFYDKLNLSVQNMLNIYRMKETGYELDLKAHLFLMFRLLFSNGTIGKDNKMLLSKKSIEKLKQIIKYVETNYSEKITIETAANLCGFSPSHFMRFFKSSIGTTFTKYVNDYRLNIASGQLLSSDLSILDIAQNSGFENLSYFNRVFKAKFSVTPNKFRQQAKISTSCLPPEP